MCDCSEKCACRESGLECTDSCLCKENCECGGEVESIHACACGGSCGC